LKVGKLLEKQSKDKKEERKKLLKEQERRKKILAMLDKEDIEDGIIKANS